jgi:hypothetical protein
MRARFAQVALAANAAAGVALTIVYGVLVMNAGGEARAPLYQFVEWVLLSWGALTFLPWLHEAYRRALALNPVKALRVEWARGPVLGFFIPVANLFRPYRAIRELNEALDPDLVPVAPPRAADTGGSYREPAGVVFAKRTPAPSAPVTLWWALWLARGATGVVASALPRFSPSRELLVATALTYAVSAAAAWGAVLVVTRIEGRLDESARRRAALLET